MDLTRRQFLKLAGGAGGAAALAALLGPWAKWAGAMGQAAAQSDDELSPPILAPYNVVWILTDDQDYQTWADQFTYADRGGRPLLAEDGQPQKGWAMPFLKSQPGGGWVDFSHTVCPHSICSPARATMLTGTYAHEHGVTGNGKIENLDATNALPMWLQARGYDVALYGKYSFGKNDSKTPRPPGWAVFERGGRSNTVFKRGVQYIEDMAARPDPRPFVLCLWPGDPHKPYKIYPEHKKINLIPPPMQPNVGEADVTDKPQWVQRQKIRKPNNKDRASAIKSVMGIDQGIQSIYGALQAHGLLENTVIIFASDNGYLWGNHRLTAKDAPYDEAARVPLVMRLPWLAENRTEDRIVSHVDITATIVDITGATPGRNLAGQSLLPLAYDPATPWPGVAYMGCYGSRLRPEWHGLRTGGDQMPPYTYVEYPATGEVELYDMTTDPAQLHNVAGQPEYAEAQAALAMLLQQELARY